MIKDGLQKKNAFNEVFVYPNLWLKGKYVVDNKNRASKIVILTSIETLQHGHSFQDATFDNDLEAKRLGLTSI